MNFEYDFWAKVKALVMRDPSCNTVYIHFHCWYTAIYTTYMHLIIKCISSIWKRTYSCDFFATTHLCAVIKNVFWVMLHVQSWWLPWSSLCLAPVCFLLSNDVQTAGVSSYCSNVQPYKETVPLKKKCELKTQAVLWAQCSVCSSNSHTLRPRWVVMCWFV